MDYIDLKVGYRNATASERNCAIKPNKMKAIATVRDPATTYRGFTPALASMI